MNFPRAFPFVLFASIWLLTGLSSLHALTVTGLKVFGDSLSDQGNSDAAISLPSSASPLYYEGRWSNGPVWVEYLNGALGLAPITRNNGVAVTGANFAYGGSTSGLQTDISGGALPNLQTQVELYLSNTQGAGPNGSIGTDLFVIWSGGNDVINKVEGRTAGDPLSGPANISLAITNLYAAGARQFLVPNLPALGFKPSFRSTAAEATANDLVDDFNSSLRFELDQLQTAHPDIVILRLDVYSLVNSILLDPAVYGFTNVTEGALMDGALDPENYLFWDGTHPTTAGHQLIANEALALIPEPCTIALSSMGMILVAVAARRRRNSRT